MDAQGQPSKLERDGDRILLRQRVIRDGLRSSAGGSIQNSKDVADGADLMIDFGWLRMADTGRATTYELHPKAAGMLGL